MNYHDYIPSPDEKPLDRLVEGYSHTSIFRTMAFIGDSLSSGEFETHLPDQPVGYHDMYEYSWGQFIARNNGIKAYNFSRGGMTAKCYLESFADENNLWDPAKACQAYVIALGVNDIYNCCGEIGTIDDVDVNDYRNNKPTFLGNYATIVSRYKELVPDAKFFFVTFIDEGKKEIEQTLGMVNGLKALAEVFDNCYVIDLYHHAPFFGKEIRHQYYLYSHLNPSGYMFIARMVDSYIDYIIRHNPDDFRNVGFIGSGIKY